MSEREVVLFVGLPGAGKSTFFRERFAETHAHVSKDLMPRSARHKGRRQHRQIAEALEQGKSVVVDNTNVTREDRAPVIEQAHALGARVVGYFFLSSPPASSERNARREGKARVPDAAIRHFARRLEPPRLEEGFDALYVVHTLEGAFRVEPFRERSTRGPRSSDPPDPNPGGARR